MASGIVLSIRPPALASRSHAAGGGDRRSDAAGGRKWWAPLFGWPAEADYIDGAGAAAGPVEEAAAKRPPTRRFAAFTEEKARELRMRTMETESFHDAMYHSAIASRLASDLPRRPGQ